MEVIEPKFEPVPEFLLASASLVSGEQIMMRPLRSDDAARFSDYLRGLSQATRARYGPHPFDQAAAEARRGCTVSAGALRHTYRWGPGLSGRWPIVRPLKPAVGHS